MRAFTSTLAPVLVAAVLGGCSLVAPSAPDVAAGAGSSRAARPADVVADAVARTQAAESGRFHMDVRIGVSGPSGGPLAHTVVDGAFDHGRGAVDLRVDLAEMVEGMPEVAAGIPPHLLADVLEVRSIGARGWSRGRSDGPWMEVPVEDAEIRLLEELGGPEAMLSFVVAGLEGGGEVEALGAGRYAGHISASALREARRRGAPVDGLGAVGEITSAMPPEVDERFFRYELVLDAAGLVESLVVELDVDAILEAVGEALDQERPVVRFEVEWTDLGEPVEIEPPSDVTAAPDVAPQSSVAN